MTEWRSGDTAPKDGELFLAFWTPYWDYPEAGNFAVIRWNGDDWKGDEGWVNPPDFWLPLNLLTLDRQIKRRAEGGGK